MRLYRFTIPSDYPFGTEEHFNPSKRKGVYVEAQNLIIAKQEIATIIGKSEHLLSPDLGFLNGIEVVIPFLR